MKIRSVLQVILEQKAIGAIGIGFPASLVVDQYGEPSERIDPQQFDLSDGCEIWNYDELQVWCDETGTIDRFFYNTQKKSRAISNENFNNDIENCREVLEDCDVATFIDIFGVDESNVEKKATMISLSFWLGEGVEVFAVFTRENSDPNPGNQFLLSLLRMNSRGRKK